MANPTGINQYTKFGQSRKTAAAKRKELTPSAQRQATSIAQKIDTKQGAIGMAREARKMKKGGAQHYQSPREMKLAGEVSGLRQQVFSLSKTGRKKLTFRPAFK